MTSVSSYLGCIKDCIGWEKDYAVNESGTLNFRSLNIFQRFFRVLGFYKNTHLSVVGTVAYQACFKPNQNWLPKEKKIITKIVKEITKPKFWFLLPSGPCHCNLGTVKLDTGETVTYEGNLKSEKNVYSFDIKITKDKNTRQSHICLQKSNTNSFNIVKIQAFDINNPSFLTDPNDVLAKMTYLFLSKIVNDSHHLNDMVIAFNNLYPYVQLEPPPFYRRIGGAEVAQKYGFFGKVQGYKNIGNHIIGDPTDLKLEKDQARQLSKNYPLNNPVAVDFLLT